MGEAIVLQDLLEQLSRWGNKGELKANTARSLKSACERVLTVMGTPAHLDIREINLDDAIRRFHNLNPNVAAKSLRDYRSRVEKALGMFLDFKRDPVNWKPGARKSRTSNETRDSQRSTATGTRRSRTSSNSSVQLSEGAPAQTLTIPFPLRPNLTVSISGLPRDLKSTECERLAAFLRALAIDFQADSN